MIGEVAAGRARRRNNVVRLAKAQLEGGVPWGEILIGHNSLFVCQKCGTEYHVSSNLDPCAFCDGCKDAVLDMLAEAVINARKVKRRRR